MEGLKDTGDNVLSCVAIFKIGTSVANSWFLNSIFKTKVILFGSCLGVFLDDVINIRH